MADDGGREASGRRPYDGRPADDLFAWDELTPSRGSERGRRQGAAGPDTAGRRPAPVSGDEWGDWLEPGAGAQRGAPGAPAAGGTKPRPKGAPRRRRVSAGAALLAMLLGFFVAGLLGAKAIQTNVRGEPYGASRSVALALLTPMTALSGALRLDRPGEALNGVLGREGEPHHSLAEIKPAKPLWPRTISATHPLKMYVAGDSMAQVFGSSLVNLAEKTGLIDGTLDYHVSTGLSRPDYFDWPQRLVDMLVVKRPDAAVMLFGANDGQNVMSQGKVVKVGSPGWRELYARRVGRAMDILTKGGRRVYWVGNPIMRDRGYRARIAMMDAIYRAEAAKHPGVTFIPTWRLFAGKKGAYAEYLRDASGDLVLMRLPDGIHLTRAGGDRMAQAVLDVIERDWKIPQRP